MNIIERTVIYGVTVMPEFNSIHVLWNNITERDGVEIERTNHRRAYIESERDKFLADIPDGAKYVEAAGWK